MNESDARDIRVVADALYTMIEQLLNVKVGFEIITTKPEEMPEAMVQMVPSDPLVRRYRCGDWIGQQKWSLYMRVAVTDTADRIDAVAALSDAASIIEGAAPQLPLGFTHRWTSAESTPTMRDATEAFETWQVTFATQYKRSKER